jgi:hypothetical protein
MMVCLSNMSLRYTKWQTRVRRKQMKDTIVAIIGGAVTALLIVAIFCFVIIAINGH